MKHYDPVAARQAVADLKIGAATEAAKQKEQELKKEIERPIRWINQQLEWANAMIARFDERLISHFVEGWTGRVSDFLHGPDSDIEVAFLIPHGDEDPPQGSTEYDREKYFSLRHKIETRDNISLSDLEQDPGIGTIMRLLQAKGYEVELHAWKHYADTVDHRSFVDLAGIVIAVKIPTEGQLRDQIETRVAKALRKRAASRVDSIIKKEAITALSEGKYILEVDRFSSNAGLRIRLQNKYYERERGVWEVKKDQQPLFMQAVKKDPYFEALLTKLRERNLTPIIKEDKIMVRI